MKQNKQHMVDLIQPIISLFKLLSMHFLLIVAAAVFNELEERVNKKTYIYACCLSIYYIYVDIKTAHGVYSTTGSYHNDKPPQDPSDKMKDYFFTRCCY